MVHNLVQSCGIQAPVPLRMEDEDNKGWIVVQKFPRKGELYKLFFGMGRTLKTKQSGHYLRVGRNEISQALEVGTNMLGFGHARVCSPTQELYVHLDRNPMQLLMV